MKIGKRDRYGNVIVNRPQEYKDAIAEARQFPREEPQPQRYKSCPDCGGFGEVIKTTGERPAKCWRCHGQGTVQP